MRLFMTLLLSFAVAFQAMAQTHGVQNPCPMIHASMSQTSSLQTSSFHTNTTHTNHTQTAHKMDHSIHAVPSTPPAHTHDCCKTKNMAGGSCEQACHCSEACGTSHAYLPHGLIATQIPTHEDTAQQPHTYRLVSFDATGVWRPPTQR